jgi:hypothetical protein
VVRWLVTAAALLLVLAVVAELAALPVASRMVSDALARCVPHEGAVVEEVRRPAVPRLLVGRARDVELVVSGGRFQDLRVEEAQVHLPEVVLPWAPRQPEVLPPATMVLTTTEADLAAWLAERAPLGIAPAIELSPGVAALGIEGLPARIRLEAEVRDGTLRLAPAGRVPAWFASIGLDLEIDLPEDVRVASLAIGDGELATTVEVAVVPGLGADDDCEGSFR